METEPSSRPKLPLLFSMKSEPVAVGIIDSPIHTSASVPFRWEEEPGKPRHSTNNLLLPSKSLELPPRLVFSEFSKMTKLPSPNTVLDGPSIMSRNSSRFSSFSFRISKVSRGQGWSFDTNTTPSSSSSSSSSIMSKQARFCSSSFRLLREGQGQLWSFDTTTPQGEGGFFGSAPQRNLNGRKEEEEEKDVGGNLIFSSSIEDQAWKLERVARNQTLFRLGKPTSHFWVTICQGIKQIFPTRNRKSKRVKT